MSRSPALNEAQIRKAAELLLSTDMTMKECAARFGCTTTTLRRYGLRAKKKWYYDLRPREAKRNENG